MADTTQAGNAGRSEKDEPLTSDAAAIPTGWEKQSEAKDSEFAESSAQNELLAAIPQEWKEAASRTWSSGEELVREHPIRSALVGLGIGMVLGFLLKGPKHG